MEKIPVTTYVSTNGISYNLYGFDDKIVVTLFGIPQMLCDITDNYIEHIETHERGIYRDRDEDGMAAEGKYGKV